MCLHSTLFPLGDCSWVLAGPRATLPRARCTHGFHPDAQSPSVWGLSHGVQPLLSWVKHPKRLRLSKEDEKNRAALGNVPVMRDGLLTGFRCGRRKSPTVRATECLVQR